MVLDLVLIGLAICLQPAAVTLFTLLLSAERGDRKGLAFVLGRLACLVTVIIAALLITGGKPPTPKSAPSTAALVVKLVMGVVLIGYGLCVLRRFGRPRKPSAWAAKLDRIRARSAAGLGAGGALTSGARGRQPSL